MKKFLALIILLIVLIIIALFVWKCHKPATVVAEPPPPPPPVAEPVVETPPPAPPTTVEVPLSMTALSQLITDKFPLKQSGLLIVNLHNPVVTYNGDQGKVLITTQGIVSKPNSSIRRGGPITLDAELGYNAQKQALLLKNPHIHDMNVANLEAQQKSQAETIITVLVEKAIGDLELYNDQQTHLMDPLGATKTLRRFQITETGLIIPIHQ